MGPAVACWIVPGPPTGHARSVVIPAYDEAEALPGLLARLVPVLEAIDAQRGGTSEVVVVDDGSRDGTARAVEALGLSPVTVVRLRRNQGKSAALDAGLDTATGGVIVLMDADGQDDPEEIPKLLDALGDPCDAEAPDSLDLVTGRRAHRNDRAAKRLPSRLYNWTTSRVTGVPGRDFNSGLKVMRADVADELDLYGELHRYIPVLASWAGYRVGEVDVTHHPRAGGQSKFGSNRFWRGMLDLVTVKFLTTYTARPFHLFGGIAALTGLVGTALLAWMLVLRISGERVGDRPALLGGVLLVVVAVQLASLGLLAELLVHLRRPGRRPRREQPR
jgi:glycosyltransferase involved in cell wall biosynthesis